MDPAPQGADPQFIVLVFWRRVDNEIEFFVPINDDYLSAMQFPVVTHAAAAGRQSATGRYMINPRSNARVIITSTGTMVAFCLTKGEAESIAHRGGWLPAHAVSDITGRMLQDVAHRL